MELAELIESHMWGPDGISEDGTKVYKPGRYRISNRKGVRPSVRQTVELTSELMCKLELGSAVQIIQIQKVPTRIRGLIDEPRGWMSITTTASEGSQFAWAERCEVNRAGAQVSRGTKGSGTSRYYCGRNMRNNMNGVIPWMCDQTTEGNALIVSTTNRIWWWSVTTSKSTRATPNWTSSNELNSSELHQLENGLSK